MALVTTVVWAGSWPGKFHMPQGWPEKKKHKKTEQTSKNEVVPFAMLVEDTSKCLAGKTSDQTVNLLHILPSVLLVDMGS